MLKDIKFCSCSSFKSDGLEENQCMFFSFTSKALKMLDDGLLKKISDIDENGKLSEGIYVGMNENRGEKYVRIHKIEDNRWRISTLYIDPFIRLLFKYLPAYYLSPEEKEKIRCD